MSNALIIGYLFLGGAGAGAFFVLAIASLLVPKDIPQGTSPEALRIHAAYRRLFGYSFLCVLLVEIGGALCLLFDLGRPDRILLFITDPHVSVVSVGAYALGALILCTVIAAVHWMGITRPKPTLLRVVMAIGLIVAAVVMVYTALLLQSFPTRPLWQSPWVLALFVISSLSTGIAFLFIVAQVSRASTEFSNVIRRMLVADTILILAESLVLGVFLYGASQGGATWSSVQTMVSGSLSEVFWVGLVASGLVIPLMCNLLVLSGRRIVPAVIAPALVLVGGVCLRVCVVLAVY